MPEFDSDTDRSVGPEPAPPTLEELTAQVSRLTMEVRARTGHSVPVGSIRFESLLDMILGPGSAERDTFERVTLAKVSEFCDEALREHRKQVLLQGGG